MTELKCGKCGLTLVKQKTVFQYMGYEVYEELPRCPACGQVYQASWQEWSARMIQGIAVLTLLGTAVLTIFSAVPMIWYPLNRKTMEQVYIRKDAAMSGTGENIGGVQEK